MRGRSHTEQEAGLAHSAELDQLFTRYRMYGTSSDVFSFGLQTSICTVPPGQLYPEGGQTLQEREAEGTYCQAVQRRQRATEAGHLPSWRLWKSGPSWRHSRAPDVQKTHRTDCAGLGAGSGLDRSSIPEEEEVLASFPFRIRCTRLFSSASLWLSSQLHRVSISDRAPPRRRLRPGARLLTGDRPLFSRFEPSRSKL